MLKSSATLLAIANEANLHGKGIYNINIVP